MLKKFDLPPIWTLGLAAVGLVLALALPLYSFGGPLTRWLGGAAMVAGVLLVLWSAKWFRRKATTIDPRKIPTHLIIEGPYQFSRNPIYSGMALFLLGWGVMLGALSALAMPLIFTWLITRRFILREEANLRQQFGPAAQAFFAKTRRW